ncbi:ABC transporter ATP-binding protein [Roseicyclus sp. F158]|uniref:ABC transporter ATP-binding protein n=1 Tax=Tropicimonas omnivorans TaxID=3075590 RepID=A0ABU3DE81_9RHOB|nr:ABC transporter ATP-binding protein [Roseicyclus sp. F158]MDT0682014.1 ABC transporter ATP-binding protein [Roseicyclus sp. F158]
MDMQTKDADTVVEAQNIRINEVSKAYPTPQNEQMVVLEDINLEIRHNEFVCLVGASGCGKTTLLKILGGLVEPTLGNVQIGTGVEKEPLMGFVFQADSLIPWRTVQRNVGLGLELQGVPRDKENRRVSDVLEMVKLSGFGRHFPRELSGGMRQRVNIARALAMQPDFLLMDEPFAALDAQTREVMQSELLALTQRLNSTVVFVTHQIDEAVLLADRIVVLSSRPGRVKKIVTPPFARPRDPGIRRSKEFIDMVNGIWSLIRDEVEEGIERELLGS